MVTRSGRNSFFHDTRTLMVLRLSGVLPAANEDGYIVLCNKLSFRPDRALKHKPAEWSRSSALIKATYSTLILAERRNAYSFALNLGQDKIASLMKGPRGPIDMLHREMARKFKRKLGHSVEFWLHADLGRDKSRKGAGTVKSLHVHGVIEFKPEEMDKIKRIFFEISGDYYRPKALSLKPVDMALSIFIGPGDHAVRNQHWVKYMVPGKLYSCTSKLNGEASATYTRHRSHYLRHNS